MKRAILIVKGEVQRVGYRDAVEKIARKLNIRGFVENLKPYDVRIVAEGEDADISKFIEQIKINKFSIDVESTEVGFEEYKSEFEYFEIKRGDWHEELLERLDTAGTLLYKSVELGEKSVELGEKSVVLGEKSVVLGEESVNIGKKMLEKQDMMLEKQDDTIAAIGEVSEKIDGAKEEIVTEVGSLREDLRSYMENKFAKIEYEIAEIKAKVGIV
jgi:acylphosphatase